MKKFAEVVFNISLDHSFSYKIPNEMIKAVKKNIDIPLLIGGGIRSVKTAKEKVLAGADIIITGTALEQESDVKQAIGAIIHELKR